MLPTVNLNNQPLLRATKSTIYLPIGCCLRNLSGPDLIHSPPSRPSPARGEGAWIGHQSFMGRPTFPHKGRRGCYSSSWCRFRHIRQGERGLFSIAESAASGM